MFVGINADSVRFWIDMKDIGRFQSAEHQEAGHAHPNRDNNNAYNLSAQCIQCAAIKEARRAQGR